MNQTEHKRMWLLLAKKMADEATEKELAELNQLLQQNPAINEQAAMNSIWWSLTTQKRPTEIHFHTAPAIKVLNAVIEILCLITSVVCTILIVLWIAYALISL